VVLKRFPFLAVNSRPPPAHQLAKMSETERFAQVVTTSIERINEHLVETIGWSPPDGNVVEYFFGPHSPPHWDELSEKQSAALMTEAKKIGTAYFTAPCFDMATQLRATDPDSVRPPRDLRVVPTSQLDRLNSDEWKQIFGVRFEHMNPQSLARMDRASCVVQLGDALGLKGDFGTVHNDELFFNRAMAGDYGLDLAVAIAETTRLAWMAAERVGPHLDALPAMKEIGGRIVFIPDGTRELQEVSTTTGHALALLTAARVPGKTLGEVIDAIAKDRLLHQMAAGGPYAFYPPLGYNGYRPRTPITFVKGRAQIPQDLRDFVQETRTSRTLPSSEAKHGLGFLRATQEQIHRIFRTSTQKGCPVATLGPLVRADGTLYQCQTSGVEAMTSAYLDLLKRVLASESHRRLVAKARAELQRAEAAGAGMAPAAGFDAVA
jgi:hypothetical protein